MPKASRRPPSRAKRPTSNAASSKDTIQGRPIARAKRPDYQQLAVYIPKALHRQLRIAAVMDDREQADIIAEALTEWVGRRERTAAKRPT